MEREWHIGVVIPARNEQDHIAGVLESLPNTVDLAVVVDDGSTDETYQRANDAASTCEVIVLKTAGEGVGAAIDRGHQHLLKTLPQPFASIVMAGDGQMNPDDLHALVSPLLQGEADHVKGNRNMHPNGYNRMPTTRQRASKILGWLTTLASGLPVTDPQCGYTATSSEVLKEWNWARSWKTYGYPNYWLINLSKEGWRVAEIPVESIYRNEVSGIKSFSFFSTVGWMMTREHHRRNIAWLMPPLVLPHSLFALLAYVLGWSAMLPMLTNDLEQELVGRGIPPVFLVLLFWSLAHVFDRQATRIRRELRRNAKT